jgi:hypothetical protein
MTVRLWPTAEVHYRNNTSSELGCGFNRSLQHLVSIRREEEVADEEIPTEDSLHRNRQRAGVGHYRIIKFGGLIGLFLLRQLELELDSGELLFGKSGAGEYFLPARIGMKNFELRCVPGVHEG